MSQVKNSVFLIGNLGLDPETRELADNKRVSRFSVATTDTYRNQKGERVDSTQWHRCVAWGKMAESAQQLLSKGRKVAVQGKLTYGEYTDADGAPRKTVEIVVYDFAVLDSKPQPAQ